jgi:hypothetical protein
VNLNTNCHSEFISESVLILRIQILKQVQDDRKKYEKERFAKYKDEED